LLLGYVVLALPLLAQTTQLNGAGATFPYPMYSKWFSEYNKLHPDVQINYQSIGSGGGIRQVLAQTVEFGASDGPMTDEQLSQAKVKILHIPTVLGAVVPAYNVPGFRRNQVHAKRSTSFSARSPTGTIPPSPGVIGRKFSNQPIIVIHRSDNMGPPTSSPTTSPKSAKVGSQGRKRGPIGLGGKGNEGVAGQVRQLPGSIGYVELIPPCKRHFLRLGQECRRHIREASLDG
jgi:phosphate transport system substrate-binding protein